MYTVLIKLRSDIDHSDALHSLPGDPDSRHQCSTLHRFHLPRPLLQRPQSLTDSNYHLHPPPRPIILLCSREQQRDFLHRSIKCLQWYIRIQRRRCRYSDLPWQLGRTSMVEHHCHQNARRYKLTLGREGEAWKKEEQRLGEAGV